MKTLLAILTISMVATTSQAAWTRISQDNLPTYKRALKEALNDGISSGRFDGDCAERLKYTGFAQNPDNNDNPSPAMQIEESQDGYISDSVQPLFSFIKTERIDPRSSDREILTISTDAENKKVTQFNFVVEKTRTTNENTGDLKNPNYQDVTRTTTTDNVTCGL